MSDIPERPEGYYWTRNTSEEWQVREWWNDRWWEMSITCEDPESIGARVELLA